MADRKIQMHKKNSDGTYDNLYPVSNASFITTTDGSNVQAKLNNSVQSATIDGVVVPKSGTTLQFPAYPTSKKVARFVIGTSTSGWTSADCDYLCNGTADQTEINAAITALPATGGEIVILDGTYNITATINVTKDNVSIRGNGNATILKRMYDSSVDEGVITLTGRIGCKIANLQVDGNKTIYTANRNHGIFLSYSNRNTVTGNICNNISDYGIDLEYSNENIITGNICNNNYSGIILVRSSNNTVTGNICNSNDRDGIFIFTDSNENIITGNICYNNSSCGLEMSFNQNNTITGNNSCDNTYGIKFQNISNSTITGNTCIRGTGLATDYTANQYTIYVNEQDNTYNLISNNNCMGKAVTNDGGTGNTLVNNKYNAT